MRIPLYLAAAMLASPVVAAERVPMPVQCGTVEELVEVISAAHEQMLLLGTDGDGGTMQVWTNLDTGSWSIVLMRSATAGCLIMSGEGAQPYAGPRPKMQPPGDPA